MTSYDLVSQADINRAQREEVHSADEPPTPETKANKAIGKLHEAVNHISDLIAAEETRNAMLMRAGALGAEGYRLANFAHAERFLK